ncbi:hypothetical protein CDAR_580731 [Caerostris darwini]|uniref:Uncharacterized protein n=1 Tax=Caerostris darwini TaxID=1538125 RepID=A0AAV4TW28_9ARAC|nr:hypothetical protein CDAR_580731 [Caerostris darwini]
MKIAKNKTTLSIREAFTLYFNPHRIPTYTSFLFLQSILSLHVLLISRPSILIKSPHPYHHSSFNPDPSLLLERTGQNSMSPKDSYLVYLRGFSLGMN